MKRRLKQFGGLHVAALWIACCAFAGQASMAEATVQIGQLAPETPAANCTTSGLDYLQPSVTGGNLYVAKEAGTIVSWSTNSVDSGATYVLKVFRRTTDPDSFQVMGHSPPHVLTTGLNTVPVSMHVDSGDMLGYHETGPANSCAFSQFGDNVLNRAGDLADGTSGVFAPQNDLRLNLSAALVPDNGFTIGAITKDRKNGTASITVTTTNPGIVSIAGKGMKKRPSKSLAVKGSVTFAIAAVGKRKRGLLRKGRVGVTPRITFFPIGGDPAIQTLGVRLLTRRLPTPG
jgi:hypothetical protein